MKLPALWHAHWFAHQAQRDRDDDTRDLEVALSEHVDRLRDLTVQLEREIQVVRGEKEPAR